MINDCKNINPKRFVIWKQISKTWDLPYICLFTNQGPSRGIYIKKSNIIIIVAKIMDGWNTWNELIRFCVLHIYKIFHRYNEMYISQMSKIIHCMQLYNNIWINKVTWAATLQLATSSLWKLFNKLPIALHVHVIWKS